MESENNLNKEVSNVPLSPMSPKRSPSRPNRFLSAQINFFDTAFSETSPAQSPASKSLSKPSFCFVEGFQTRFVCGTEDQQNPDGNQLIFASLENGSISITFTEEIVDAVRDIAWINENTFCVASANKLSVARLCDKDFELKEMLVFPEFHREIIREIKMSKYHPHLLLSGGFDGQVQITDINRLLADFQCKREKSQNSLYSARSAVGSVNWHPSQIHTCSATTDIGEFHMFDCRVNQKRPAIISDLGKEKLYTHCYMNELVMLGYGDGEIRLLDPRVNKSLSSFRDPFVHCIGDISVSEESKLFAVFGSPEMSMWSFDPQKASIITHHAMATPSQYESVHSSDIMYKTAGVMRKRTVIGTDSLGNLVLLTACGNSKERNTT